MNKKDLLAVTNPFTYILGLPLVMGIFLGVSVRKSFKETIKIVEDI